MIGGPELEERMTGLFKSVFGKKVEGLGAEQVEGSAAEPSHVTDDLFEEMVLNAPLPTLVDFWAPWCGPCRMIAPIVQDLAKDYDGRAVFAKINTDENVQVAGRLGIMGIPTMVLFKDGEEVDRIVGFVPRRVLEEKLRAVLN
jgi:thioredoxin 1